jgi:L,D-transpeptidase catalytic domain
MSRFARVLTGTVLLLLSVPATRANSEISPEPIKTAPAVTVDAKNQNQQTTPIDFEAAVAAGASPEVLDLALNAIACATASGDIQAPPTLTLIDYSKPSIEPRLWVFDLANGALLFTELVAHGRNSGENLATEFSATLNSRQSSIGMFVTGDTYVGSNGYSLRMEGLEPGFNAHARERAIVMHGAPYVSEEIAARQGRLGRSWGCPAVREAVARNVIDTVRGGGVVFSYYPDENWLTRSRFLNGCATTNAGN